MLLDLKRAIDKCVKYAGKQAKYCSVEVWLGKRAYSIKDISQFSIIRDVSIRLGDKIVDLTKGKNFNPGFIEFDWRK